MGPDQLTQFNYQPQSRVSGIRSCLEYSTDDRSPEGPMTTLDTNCDGVKVVREYEGSAQRSGLRAPTVHRVLYTYRSQESADFREFIHLNLNTAALGIPKKSYQVGPQSPQDPPSHETILS